MATRPPRDSHTSPPNKKPRLQSNSGSSPETFVSVSPRMDLINRTLGQNHPRSSSSAPSTDVDHSHLAPIDTVQHPDSPLDTLSSMSVDEDVSTVEMHTSGFGLRPTRKDVKKKGRKGKKAAQADDTEDPLRLDVEDVLGPARHLDDIPELQRGQCGPYNMREEVQVQITALTFGGEGIGLPVEPLPHPFAIIVPHALPGEVVTARVYRCSNKRWAHGDLVHDSPHNKFNSPFRDNSLIRCKHFGQCAGCQYQMIPYGKQLELKREVVVKAFRQFSGLRMEDGIHSEGGELFQREVPVIGPTIGSPKEWGYRTKITPHFEAPPKRIAKRVQAGEQLEEGEKDWLKIGFNKIGTSNVMDIEECPIATPVLNEALGPIRKGIIDNIFNYKKGVSLLLRDSLPVPPSSRPSSPKIASRLPSPPPQSPDAHVCVTDHKAKVREYVGELMFEYTAGSFFQNNNSVLLPLTNHVRDAIFPSISPPGSDSAPTHLVDTYCGAGLFAVTLARDFEVVYGIELSQDSIANAKKNTTLNSGVVPGIGKKCTFTSGDASSIFDSVASFPRSRTCVVIDPPRKGCDKPFVKQLLQFRPQVVVYVSCSVHTQARDIGMIVKGSREQGERGVYKMESLRGFDLFPQTAHVESVAVLRLVDE